MAGVPWSTMTLLSFVPRGTELFASGLPDALEVVQCDLGASAALQTLCDLGSAEAFVDAFDQATAAVWPPKLAGSAQAGGFYFEGRLGGHAGRRFLDAGSTLYYKRVHEHAIGLAREVEALARAAGQSTSAGVVEAVVSRPGAGVSMHFDSDVAINVQIFGTKDWTWEPNTNVEAPVHAVNTSVGPSPAAVRHAIDPAYPKQMSASARTFTARPGTVIYLPRGVWHQTRVTGDETSLAVVFSLEVRTVAAQLADRLETFLHDRPAWRQSALLRPDPERAWATIGAAWDTTVADYGSLDSEDIRFALPPFASARWRFAPPDGTRLALDTGALQVIRADTTEAFELDATLAPVRPALEWISARAEPFRAAELCAAVRIDPVAIVELLRLLVNGELLVQWQNGHQNTRPP